MAARLAGDALRQRLDDPGLPARARRPQLHAGADAHLPRGARAAAASRASGHFPGYAIVAPSLLEFGNDEQKQLAPAAIRGDTIWCIGMSEPNAGSDLAGLQTRAEVHDDQFVVNGQKVWTSYATIAAEVLLLRAHRPDAPKHRGISLLIIDMDTPGIDVRPLRHINGKAELRRGVLHRRRRAAREPRRRAQRRLGASRRVRSRTNAPGLWVDSVSPARADGARAGRAREAHRPRPRPRRPAQASRRAYELAASLRALGYKGFASFAQGSSAPEHSYMKMATSEAGKAAFELGMEICGPFGAVTDPERRSRKPGAGSHGFFMSFANTIAGGSSEIQRNIIAQRVLGLPRT